MVVEWAIRKCRLFLLGLPQPFTLVVDHQALVTILDKHTLGKIENEKIKRTKEHLSQFIFQTIWRKGKEHAIPNALSRCPVNKPTEEDLAVGKDIQQCVQHCVVRVVRRIDDDGIDELEEEVISSPPPNPADPILEKLKAVAVADKHYSELINAVTTGFFGWTRKNVVVRASVLGHSKRLVGGGRTRAVREETCHPSCCPFGCVAATSRMKSGHCPY